MAHNAPGPQHTLDTAERIGHLDWHHSASRWDSRARDLVAEYYRRLLPFWPADRDRVFPDDPDVFAALTHGISPAQQDWIRQRCEALPVAATGLSRRLAAVVLAGASLVSAGRLATYEDPGAALLELFEAGFGLSHGHGTIDVLYADGMTTLPRPSRSALAAEAEAATRLILGNISVRVEPPAPPQYDTLPETWTQLAVYGQPLWGHTFTDLTRRVSIETPEAALVLFDRHDPGTVGRLLDWFGLGTQRGFAVRRAQAADPLHDGYLCCLRFVSAAPDTQAAGIAETMAAFIAEEVHRFPAVKQGITSGNESPPLPGARHTVDWLVDDSGTMDIGFGLLVQAGAGRYELRLWSRLVHYHK